MITEAEINISPKLMCNLEIKETDATFDQIAPALQRHVKAIWYALPLVKGVVIFDDSAQPFGFVINVETPHGR